jgi:hypothetical protein
VQPAGTFVIAAKTDEGRNNQEQNAHQKPDAQTSRFHKPSIASLIEL